MTSKQRVALLALNFPPESTGIAPYAGALATGLSGMGHDVIANVGQPHYPEWKVRRGYGQWSSSETIDDVDVRRRRHIIPHPPRGAMRLISELSYGLRLLVANWGSNDVVIAVSPALFATALASVRRGKTPFIIWVQDVYTLGLIETREGGALANRIIKWVESSTLQRADLVVVIHQRIADYVVHSLGVDLDRVKVIRNWTHLPDRGQIDRKGARDRRRWPVTETIILHAGNMGSKQGLINVVKAARMADERSEPVRFVLLGDGGERARLRDAADGIERIEFLDPLPDDEFRAALAGADILLVNELPGVAQMAMPSKLTSYFDAGRPVIAATDPTGITAAEIHEAGAGLVVPAGEPEQLLGAALELRADPERAERFGKNGNRHRQAFLDETAAVRQWAYLLGQLP